MTVSEQVPFIAYTGNGTTTDFAFVWTQQSVEDMVVTLNDDVMGRDIQYSVVNYDPENGGTVRFFEAPEPDASVTIERRTPLTQQLNYQNGQPFPTNTHEEQLDKDTLILQEIILGQRLQKGSFNLSATIQPAAVLIENSGGEGVTIPSWSPAEQFAGVFHGEITTAAPADNVATSKPDGYVWFQVPAP